VTPFISATPATATTTSTETVTNSSILEALSTSAAPVKDTKPVVSTRANIGYNKKQHANPAIQTGMDRYIQIKRKLSPQNNTPIRISLRAEKACK